MTMAKTVTTATDDGRERPDDKAITTVAAKCGKVGDGKFAAAYALEVLVPRSVKHWRQRDGAKMAEKAIFEAIADAKDEAGNPLVDESANTLIQWRNVAAVFPKTVRVAGVSFGAHKSLAPLAWKDNGARRSQLCEWMEENKPTVADADAHAKLMRLKDAPPTAPPADGDEEPLSASDVNGPAVTSITMDELIANVLDRCVRVDRDTDPTEDGAAIGCVETLMETLSITATQAEELITV